MPLRGDINNSGSVTTADLSAIKNYIKYPSDPNYQLADPRLAYINLDEQISTADLSALKNYIKYPNDPQYTLRGFSPIDVKINGSELELVLDVGQFSTMTTEKISGMQLYVQGVQLQSKVNDAVWLPSEAGVLTDANGDWIIACNTINAADNLSIVYLERNNDKELTKAIGSDTVILAKFPIGAGTTARIKTSVTSGGKTYTSMVVGVENQTIVEYNLL